MSVGAIVLAAGAGRRFGAAKQLAPLDGRPLLQHAVDAVRGVEGLDAVVVLGARAAAVAAGVRLDGARVVVCAEWAEGMAASLRAGVAALAPGTTAALVVLGDQPRVTPAVVARLRDAAAGAWPPAGPGPAPLAVRAAYAGAPGHPVALGPELLAAVPGLRGDAGARDLLAGGHVRLVEVGGLGDGRDVDTLEQLKALVTDTCT